jgi:hypothetical protein
VSDHPALRAVERLLSEMDELRAELRAASAVTARWVLLVGGEARLPDQGEPVLLLSETGQMVTGEWTGGGWLLDGVFYGGFGSGPIAWAEAPAAPRERKWNRWRDAISAAPTVAQPAEHDER